MPKGPRVHPDIEKYIASLVSSNSQLQAKQIEAKLQDKFAGSDTPIPALRTIQDRASRIRSRLTMQDKPWSLAVMSQQRQYHDEDIDIPWEASGYIIQAMVEMQSKVRSGQNEIKDLWSYSHETLESLRKNSDNYREETEPHLVTVRQAKWLWRFHQIFPGLKALDLIPLADAYSQRELYSDYLGWDLDTSDLDSALLLIQRDIHKHGYYPTRGDTNERTHQKKKQK